MATILTKKSDTASAVPLAADLTNAAGGAELAVNATDKRLFSKTSGGTVVELGTNPSTLVLPSGSANGVAYLNGSKVVSSSATLTWNNSTQQLGFQNAAATGYAYIGTAGAGSNTDLAFYMGASEGMRLTSTGLGIGTSSPSAKLEVNGNQIVNYSGQSQSLLTVGGGSTSAAMNLRGSTGSAYAWQISSNAFVGSALEFTRSTAVGGTTFSTPSMLLDSSGNLGLGVTPSAGGANANYRLFEIGLGGGGSLYSGGGQTLFCTNVAWSGGTANYKASSIAPLMYSQESGTHIWKIAPSGTAGNAITFTQAMTLDASGNLAVGTTSPDIFARGYARVLGISSASNSAIELNAASGQNAYFDLGVNSVRVFSLQTDASTATVQTITSIPLVFATNNTERARIDSSGNLLVGTTSAISAGKYSSSFAGATENGIILKTTLASTGSTYIGFVNSSGSIIGSVNQNGASTVAYNTSSDYRLKNTIAPMTGALGKVALLKPCTYKWNADGSDGEGFIAHELAEVVPQCVTGEKDAVDEEGNPKYQGIDTSFLVATLTAALQELNAKFDAYVASHP